MRNYYHASPRRRANQRRTYLETTYRVPLEDLDKLLVSQDNGCAICRRHWLLCKPIKRTHYEALYLQHLGVDHDHATGVIRGLLCNACNLAIGLFDENLETFSRAIAYLRRSREA